MQDSGVYSTLTSQGSRRDIDSLALGNILGKYRTDRPNMSALSPSDPVLWTGGRGTGRLNNVCAGRMASAHMRQLKPLLKTSAPAYETEIL